jgi:hypothetical protein
METWTKAELETLYPEGSIMTQVDDDFTPITTAEWRNWIDAQVGTEKIDAEHYGDTEQ